MDLLGGWELGGGAEDWNVTSGEFIGVFGKGWLLTRSMEFRNEVSDGRDERRAGHKLVECGSLK